MRRVDPAGDPRRLKVLSWPDARQQQKLGRADRAGAEDDLLRGINCRNLAAGSAVFNAGRNRACTLAFEQHPGRLRAGKDCQVRPLFRLAGKESLVSTRTPPVPRCELCQRYDTARRIAVTAV